MRKTRRMMGTGLALLAVLLTAVPAGADPAAPPERGVVVVESERSFEATWDTLIGILEANPAIAIVGVVDHAAAAASVGLDLEPNRVVFFGNPNLGTPVMQAGRTAGIDLPQKVHVYVEDGAVLVAYNGTDLLADRHGARSAPTLGTIAGALAGISSAAADSTVDTRTPGTEAYRARPGLTTIESSYGVDETWDRLLSAIDASPASIVFTLDHAANAASVGLDLLPTRLVTFGNPNLGTPLMQSSPSTGIDLPLKMLVWEDDVGSVFVSYNSTRYLEKRHQIRGTDALLTTISGALANLAAAATG